MAPPSIGVAVNVRFSPSQISLFASSDTMLTLALAAGSITVTVALQVAIFPA